MMRPQATIVAGSLNPGGRKMAWIESKQRFRPGAPVGWQAARLEFEHQAEHWDTPDHGETGHLIAQALRAAVEIARDGGLQCEHRQRDKPLSEGPDK